MFMRLSRDGGRRSPHIVITENAFAFNNFWVWHLFVACLYFSSASLLLYFPTCFSSTFLFSFPVPPRRRRRHRPCFYEFKDFSPARPFVELRITFHYSSWVNIKFNMMHQINVCSVSAFRRALKTTWRWFLLCFSFSAVFVVFMFSKADPDGVVGEVHELISMLLDSRQPQFFQRKIEIIISQTLRQKEKPSSSESGKFFPSVAALRRVSPEDGKGHEVVCDEMFRKTRHRNFFSGK